MDDVEKKIREAIASAQESGIKIICGEWGVVNIIDGHDTMYWGFLPGTDSQKCCCPMGAVLLNVACGMSDFEPEAAAANRLGVTTEWVEAFVIGFDGRSPAEGPEFNPKDPSGHAAGVKLRAELLGANGG